MWIIIVGFIGILCVVQWREQDKKDAEKAAAEAYRQAKREKISTSPNVAVIAHAIVSRCGFPERIEIQYNGVCTKNQGTYGWIGYKSLEIEDICVDDCSVLAVALCNHPSLEGKYIRKWRCETSDRDEENWLELKTSVSSITLQEW